MIRTLGLAPHPEGGFYREIFRSPVQVVPSDGRGTRSAMTMIHFLLPGGAVSRWHRVRSDEIWHIAGGDALELVELSPDEWRLTRHRIDAGSPVHCVRAGWWQAARSLGAYTLTTCLVAPGFEFADFDLLAQHPGLEARVRASVPDGIDFL